MRWTCKSVRNLEAGLRRAGHTANYRSVANLLRTPGYGLQSNRKAAEGREDPPDRDVQFHYINAQAKKFLKGYHRSSRQIPKI